MWFNLHAFYCSKEWMMLLNAIKFERINDDGILICEHCGKPIYRKYDCIGHHVIPLTLDNVNDVSISLNKDNIKLVHHKCHDEIHHRFGSYTRHIYLVYGAPMSGKTTYVNGLATKDDLVVDLDSIREAITGGKRYERSNRLNDNVFRLRDALLDMIKYKDGRWIRAFIIGGYPYVGERESLCNMLGAEPLLIDATKDECLARLETCSDGRDKVEWKKYIEDWFNIVSIG